MMLQKNKEILVENVKCNICNSNSFSVLTTGTDYEYETCSNIFRMVKCNMCGHIYLNPKPSFKELKTIYPSHYYSYDFAKSKFSLVKIGKELIERGYIKLYKHLIGNNSTILDVGCGMEDY